MKGPEALAHLALLLGPRQGQDGAGGVVAEAFGEGDLLLRRGPGRCLIRGAEMGADMSSSAAWSAHDEAWLAVSHSSVVVSSQLKRTCRFAFPRLGGLPVRMTLAIEGSAPADRWLGERCQSCGLRGDG